MSNVCTFKITEINTMYIQIKNIIYIHIFFLLQRRVRARLRWRTPVHVKAWWSSSRPLWTAWSRSHRNISFKTKNTWYQVILYLQVKTPVSLHIKSLVIALGVFLITWYLLFVSPWLRLRSWKFLGCSACRWPHPPLRSLYQLFLLLLYTEYSECVCVHVKYLWFLNDVSTGWDDRPPGTAGEPAFLQEVICWLLSEHNGTKRKKNKLKLDL